MTYKKRTSCGNWIKLGRHKKTLKSLLEPSATRCWCLTQFFWCLFSTSPYVSEKFSCHGKVVIFSQCKNPHCSPCGRPQQHRLHSWILAYEKYWIALHTAYKMKSYIYSRTSEIPSHDILRKFIKSCTFTRLATHANEPAKNKTTEKKSQTKC